MNGNTGMTMMPTDPEREKMRFANANARIAELGDDPLIAEDLRAFADERQGGTPPRDVNDARA
jgi:hypothetical protein